MTEGIAEVLNRLVEIISLQTEIIDRLAGELIQHATLDDEELEMIQQAADLQKDARDKGYI